MHREDCERSVICSWELEAGYNESKLREALEVYGPIEKVTLFSGKSPQKATAVVVFETRSSAAAAVAGLGQDPELKLCQMKPEGAPEEDLSGEGGLTSEEDLLQTKKSEEASGVAAESLLEESESGTTRGLKGDEGYKRSKRDSRERKKDRKKRKKERDPKADESRSRDPKDDRDREDEKQRRRDRDDRSQHREDHHHSQARRASKGDETRFRDRDRDSEARRKEYDEKHRRRSSARDRSPTPERKKLRNESESRRRSQDSHRELTHQDDCLRSYREEDHSPRRKASKDRRDEGLKRQERSSDEKRRCPTRASALRHESRSKRGGTESGAAAEEPYKNAGETWSWNRSFMPPFGGYQLGAYGYPLGYPSSSWYDFSSQGLGQREGSKTGKTPEKSLDQPGAIAEEPAPARSALGFARCSGRKRELLARLSVSRELAGPEAYEEYLRFMSEENIKVNPSSGNSEGSSEMAASEPDEDCCLEADPEAMAILLHRRAG